MSYKVVDIQKHLNTLDTQIADAKKKGTYAGQEQHWDNEVAKILSADCSTAEHNVKTSNDVIENQRASAQNTMNLIEKTLSKKELTKEDHQYIEQMPASIQQAVTRISEDLQDLMTANLEYRGGWPITARELLSDKGKAVLDPYVAARAKQIDGQAALMAKKQRCEQYLVRVQEFAKQAMQRKNQGAVDIASFNQDVAEIRNQMVAGLNTIKEFHEKKDRTIKSIKAQEKTKPWSPDQSKSAKSWMAEIAAVAKNARGTLKTLGVLFEGLEKRGKAAGPGWKDMAAKAIDIAKKPYKDAIVASKAFDDDEAKCLKICKDHGVSL